MNTEAINETSYVLDKGLGRVHLLFAEIMRAASVRALQRSPGWLVLPTVVRGHLTSLARSDEELERLAAEGGMLATSLAQEVQDRLGELANKVQKGGHDMGASEKPDTGGDSAASAHGDPTKPGHHEAGRGALNLPRDAPAGGSTDTEEEESDE